MLSSDKAAKALGVALLILTTTAFLLPKYQVAGLNVGVLELLCIFGILALSPYAPLSNIFIQQKRELIYCTLLLAYGFLWSLIESDTMSVIIAMRVVLFCAWSIVILNTIPIKSLEFALKTASLVILLIYTPSAINAIVSLLSGEMSLFTFLWDYDAGRLKAPHEIGTSSVPIGYLFSIISISCFQFSYRSRSNSGIWALSGVIFVLFSFLTASRAAIIGSSLSLLAYFFACTRNKARSKLPIHLAVLAIPISFAGVFLFAKSSIDDQIDGSTYQRLEYYLKALKLTFDGFAPATIGSGISDDLLYLRTGTSFYESMIFNSLVQGGLPLFLAATLVVAGPLIVCIRRCRSDDARAFLLALSANVIIGNMIAGANYFSQYSYFYFIVLLFILTKWQPRTQ